MAPYKESSRTIIAETATSVVAIFHSLSSAFTQSLRLEEKLVDLRPGEPLGPVVSEASKSTAAAEEAWRKLPIATASLAHALVDVNRTTAEGKVAYLLITESERALLLKEIELLFGERVMTGQIAGLYAPDGSAALLVQFLKQGWRTADAK